MTPRSNILQRRPGVVTVFTTGDASAPWCVSRACAQTFQAASAAAWTASHARLTDGRLRDGSVGGQTWSTYNGAARRTIVRIFEILEGA